MSYILDYPYMLAMPRVRHTIKPVKTEAVYVIYLRLHIHVRHTIKPIKTEAIYVMYVEY